MTATPANYVGRLAPSPTGYLHLGHARTFLIASERARAAGGRLLMRNDDLDRDRCRPEFVDAMQADLRWLGLEWETPMVTQSERLPLYREALARLHRAGLIFACNKSRRDVLEAATAPHESGAGAGGIGGASDDEPVYPKEFRPTERGVLPPMDQPITTNWRFRVPNGEEIVFHDEACGQQRALCGRDFGDFLVWRKDNVPSYQLASAVDDSLMGVTEVVRGADLIRSTFRQLLLWRALGAAVPRFYHCQLMVDDHGQRLAKRHDALALRMLRAEGWTPEAVRAKLFSS